MTNRLLVIFMFCFVIILGFSQRELAAVLVEHPDFKLRQKHQNRVTKDELKLLGEAYGRPMMPIRSGYQLFCHDFHQQLMASEGQVSPATWMQRASIEWKNLADEEKDVYKQRTKTVSYLKH